MIARSLILLLSLSAGLHAAEPNAAAALKKDPKWLKKIRHSIDSGVAWLVSKQNASGRFPAFVDPRGDVYELGMHALATLAVVKGGQPTDSKAVKKAEALIHSLYKRHKFTIKTYEAGLVLMLLQAKDDVATFKGGKKKRRRKKKGATRLTEEDRTLAKELALWLQSQQTPEGMWRYPEGGNDISNTQYAILGLWSAQRMGLKVDRGVIRRALKATLKRQQQDGPKVPRYVPSLDSRYGTWTPLGAKDRARAWRYMPAEERLLEDGSTKMMHYPYSGSMTSAGIAILAIGREILGEKDVWLDSKQDRLVRTSIYDGLAWIANNWDVQDNPGQRGNWPFYWLYGLERCGRLTGVDNMGKHDWYVEGAERIMSDQREDGSWPRTQRMRPPGNQNVRWWSDQVDTAFAILFLVQSTPILKIPAPVVSGGE
ncbi:MAG: hypothetical protein V3T86_13795 [Planctomycetota bacterium]